MKELRIKKIVAIGPESTGKTMLCQQLAMHYRTTWCPEYAREYLLKHGMKYTYDDLLIIAKRQIELEEKHLHAIPQQGSTDGGTGKKDWPMLFIDTNMYVMKVWCEFVFGKCHPFILDQIGKRVYDLYLLCDTDLAWIKDELREYPDHETRKTLYGIYKEIMIAQPVPWLDISGNYAERLRKAIAGIDGLLKK
jgi:NadR type nicotinamide-nucleotide adenylyltransferase